MNKKLTIILLLGTLLITTLGVFLTFFNKSENESVEVEADQLNIDCFNRSGQYLSYEDDKYYSSIGVDVSEHNETIDFEKVKDSGIDFVFMRIGRRGYYEGLLQEDIYFEEYYTKAKEAGLKIGVYFFSQAINENEAKEEAQFALKILDGRELDLGIAYDFEDITYDIGRANNISKEQTTKNALSFFDTIGDEYPVILYSNNDCINKYFDMEILSKYDLWYAQYYEYPQCNYKIKAWQYTDSGEVPGLGFDADINIMFIEK